MTNLNQSPWLHALSDPLANIKTTTSCFRLGDLSGDGDSNLCVCDMDKKLRVFKGTSQILEYALMDIPVSMCVIYADTAKPKIPSIAVASGTTVFIYRQLRPYKKWTCPIIPISKVESNIWKDLHYSNITIDSAVKSLSDARENGTKLTMKSLEFLNLDNDDLRNTYILENKDMPPSYNPLITCMETMKRDNEEIDGTNVLVVGTELGHVYILPPEPNGSIILCQVELPSIPVSLNIIGLYEVEWRISVICRDGKLYHIKNGDIRNTAVISGAINDIGAMPITLTRQDKNIWIGCMDKSLSCYSIRGKKLHTILMQEDIVEICVIELERSKISSLLLVALVTGEIRLYKETTLVDTFIIIPPILAIRYGSYGREENCLVIAHGKNGTLTVKIWKRQADMEHLKSLGGPPPEQDIPLAIPKKTKLFVEQTQREREQASQIHRTFQRDLTKIRLETARAYVKTLGIGHRSTSTTKGGTMDLRLTAQILGLGPDFILKLSLQNSGNLPIFNAKLLLNYDHAMYSTDHTRTSTSALTLPPILPGPMYTFDAEIKCIDLQGRASTIMAIVYNATPGIGNSQQPLLSANIRMPPSELLME